MFESIGSPKFDVHWISCTVGMQIGMIYSLDAIPICIDFLWWSFSAVSLQMFTTTLYCSCECESAPTVGVVVSAWNVADVTNVSIENEGPYCVQSLTSLHTLSQSFALAIGKGNSRLARITGFKSQSGVTFVHYSYSSRFIILNDKIMFFPD